MEWSEWGCGCKFPSGMGRKGKKQLFDLGKLVLLRIFFFFACLKILFSWVIQSNWKKTNLQLSRRGKSWVWKSKLLGTIVFPNWFWYLRDYRPGPLFFGFLLVGSHLWGELLAPFFFSPKRCVFSFRTITEVLTILLWVHASRQPCGCFSYAWKCLLHTSMLWPTLQGLNRSPVCK